MLSRGIFPSAFLSRPEECSSQLGQFRSTLARTANVCSRRPQVGTSRLVTSAVGTFTEERVAEATSTSACPFHAVQAAVADAGFMLPRTQSIPRQSREVETPGPDVFSWDSMVDVGTIVIGGMHIAMLRFSEKYGPVCRFVNPTNLNGVAGWLFLNGPDDVQWVCSSNTKNYTSRYLPDIYKYVTHEKGILGSQGEYNKKHRRLCAPAFRNRDLLSHFAETITARTQVLIDLWKPLGVFETDIALQTQRLTMDIVGLTAFSHDFRQTEMASRDAWTPGQHRLPWGGLAPTSSEEDHGLVWAVNTFGEVLAKVFITPMPVLRFLEKIGNKHLRLLDETITIMRTALMAVIQDRRSQIMAGENVPSDVLTALLQTTDDDGQPMTDEELWEDVHDIMGAGHETTATTTASTLYCISAHPEVERRIVAELQRVLGGRPPVMEDLERLPYLTATVKEVLRIYPAIPIFPRVADAADTLPSGHKVLPGDVVFMSSYSLGRSLDIWPDGDQFRPDRFLGAELEAQHRYQYLPFGAGPRMCLGSQFAQMSVAMMVATLIQAYKFKPVYPTTKEIPVEYDITMNFNKTNGLRMEVQPR